MSSTLPSHDSPAPPSAPVPFDSAPGAFSGDSQFDAGALERAAGVRPARDGGRWMGWRLRLLVGLALLGCLGIVALLRSLAATPHIDATWRSTAAGRIELAGSSDPVLRGLQGHALQGLVRPDGSLLPGDALVLQRSARWVVSDTERARLTRLSQDLAQAMAQPQVRLLFDDASLVDVRPQARGLAALGALFWMLCALALVLFLLAAVVLLAQPNGRSLLFALITLSQTANLLLIAVESVPSLGQPPGLTRVDTVLRVALDALFSAAVLHAACLYPRPLPWRPLVAGSGWLAALSLTAWALLGDGSGLWWATQLVMLACGVAVIAMLTWSYRLEPHPYAIVLRRFGGVTTATLALLTLAVALASRQPLVQHTIATVGPVIWYVFVASLLLLAPFVSRTQGVVREFALVAGVSTVAFSLDLLFVAVFALGQLASVTLLLFLALGLYAAVRQWLLSQMVGSHTLTTERMFESLYRVAREVEAAPNNSTEHVSRLLRELFEPLEVTRLPRQVSRSRVLGDGSTLVVPVPALPLAPGADESDGEGAPGAISLRFARRGRRMFTEDDARLADRVLEQLARAVAYDRAVEHGRSEERTRIAQDLHDDIGARLLTLMYKAQTPEMEEYVRHTLQDLKTLTRGLAASNHRLSHAAAEWKADLSQRLTAAHCDLAWSFSMDRDVNLSVVQWSALTRVLRELVNNIIAHAQATRVEVTAAYERGRFSLSVSDDGVGHDPGDWAHGLGLGGVRKRVKLLGGDVRWRERTSTRGIVCEMRVPELGERR
ncbi:histidine kinase [Burkholderiales bacterium JOSHI_001]|nr:histidine kinase [Burkholderiales bacterium JOSHI_001]